MNEKSRKMTPRIMNLIIRDMDTKDWKIGVENFWVDEDVEDPERALREAVQNFLKSGTEAAREAISYSCGYFNWGDVMSSVPDELFARHGLRKMSGCEAVDVNVEHDEILFDEEYEE